MNQKNQDYFLFNQLEWVKEGHDLSESLTPSLNHKITKDRLISILENSDQYPALLLPDINGRPNVIVREWDIDKAQETLNEFGLILKGENRNYRKASSIRSLVEQLGFYD